MRKIQWTDCKSNGNELFKMGEGKLARQQAEAKQKKNTHTTIQTNCASYSHMYTRLRHHTPKGMDLYECQKGCTSMLTRVCNKHAYSGLPDIYTSYNTTGQYHRQPDCTCMFTRGYFILRLHCLYLHLHTSLWHIAYTACTSICTRDYDTSHFHCLYLHLYTRLWHFTLTLLVPPSVHKTLTLHAYTACTSICTRDPDTTRGYDTTCSRWLYLHVYMGLWHYKLTLVVPPSLAYPGCPSIFTWIYDTTSLPWLYLHLSMGLWHYTLTLAVSLSLHRTMTLHTYTGLYPIFSWGHATSRSYDTTCLHWLYLHLYTRIWHNTLRWLYLHYTKLRHYTLTWLYIHLYIRKCHYTLTLAVPPPVHLDMSLHTYTGCTSTRLWIRHYASNSRCTSIFTRGYAYRGWSIIKTQFCCVNNCCLLFRCLGVGVRRVCVCSHNSFKALTVYNVPAFVEWKMLPVSTTRNRCYSISCLLTGTDHSSLINTSLLQKIITVLSLWE